MSKRMILLMLATVGLSTGQFCIPDTDRDGVSDTLDNCRDTPLCATVDAVGCPSDSDNDGVYDGCDECPQTTEGDTVYANGCTVPAGTPSSSCTGTDPAAIRIEYSLNNRTGTTGEITIKGIAENIGPSNYTSDAGQQSLELWEDGNKVAAKAFQNLAAGATVEVEYVRTWNTQETEFPPTRYQLIISYDPDIRDDGNPNNDDCDLGNNHIIRRASDINTLFD